MLNTIKNAFRIPDLRKKLLFTLLVIVVFRFGSVIPVPFLDVSALGELMARVDATPLGYVNMLTGGAFGNATLFAMGITPYINSSIIMQLLTVAIGPLERMAREGEEGRKRIASITRYVTVALGLIQGTAYFFYLRSNGITEFNDGFGAWFSAIVIIFVFTAGTAPVSYTHLDVYKRQDRFTEKTGEGHKKFMTFPWLCRIIKSRICPIVGGKRRLTHVSRKNSGRR